MADELLPERVNYDGRWATVTYLDANWQPVTLDEARLAIALFDDGSKAIMTVTDAD